MSTSKLLRLEEIRAAFRLVGDCRDLGHDPAKWNHLLVRGLSSMFGCYMTNSFALWADKGAGPIIADLLADDWPDSKAYQWWLKYIQTEGLRAQPSVLAFHRPFTETTTCRRVDLIPDGVWATSAERTEFRAPACQDEFLYTATPIDGGPGYHGITLNRAVGEPGFTEREREQVALIHEEIGELLGTRLLLKPNELLATLSPRLREVLAAVLEGDSEKQAAARLGLSRHTVHEYVGMLYERFGVCSRAALVGAYLRMSGHPGSS